MTRNAQDIIDDMRNIVKPRIAKMLLEANYEGCGKEDKAEFETEFEMLLTLAEKTLEQEPKTGYWIMTNDYFTGAYRNIDCVKCSCCGEYSLGESDFCPNCGAKMIES